MRPGWHLHPDPAHPNRGQQLRQLLQEPVVAQRGGVQEAHARAKKERDGDAYARQLAQHSHCARYLRSAQPG